MYIFKGSMRSTNEIQDDSDENLITEFSVINEKKIVKHLEYVKRQTIAKLCVTKLLDAVCQSVTDTFELILKI